MRRAVRIASLLVAASLACWAAPTGAQEHGPHAGHGPDALTLEPGEVGPDSIYQLASRWTTPDGRDVPLASLAGRVRVLAMVYTHCQHACPRIIADMRRLRRDLGDVGERVGYVLVSLDPERDDAARLAEFAKQSKLFEGWTLLRSDENAVRELAAVLGVRYRRISESDFVHSNLVTVLDANGVVVHRQVGLGVDPAKSAAAIRALLAAPR